MPETRDATLNASDHRALTTLLERIIKLAADGQVSVGEAAGAVQHLIAAADIGNYDEIRTWAREPDRVLGNWVEGLRAAKPS